MSIRWQAATKRRYRVRSFYVLAKQFHVEEQAQMRRRAFRPAMRSTERW
jgi:hypothetical protein